MHLAPLKPKVKMCLKIFSIGIGLKCYSICHGGTVIDIACQILLSIFPVKFQSRTAYVLTPNGSYRYQITNMWKKVIPIFYTCYFVRFHEQHSVSQLFAVLF